MLQSAWHNAPELSIFGTGDNVLPTIHIRDLAALVIDTLCSYGHVLSIIFREC
jgi:adenylate kinase